MHRFSQFAMLHERVDFLACDNQMIKYAHLDQAKRITQQMRDFMVLATRASLTGRMVVSQYAGGCVAMQRSPDHFTRMYLSSCECAPK